ncbi:fad NAD binding oxidoreductase [Hortaea werneckii]|nr:fad NAD binding oxidoreductase [Hortaea werneckii]
MPLPHTSMVDVRVSVLIASADFSFLLMQYASMASSTGRVSSNGYPLPGGRLAWFIPALARVAEGEEARVERLAAYLQPGTSSRERGASATVWALSGTTAVDALLRPTSGISSREGSVSAPLRALSGITAADAPLRHSSQQRRRIVDHEPNVTGRSRGRPRYKDQLCRPHLQDPKLYCGRKKHHVSLNTMAVGNLQWANHLDEENSQLFQCQPEFEYRCAGLWSLNKATAIWSLIWKSSILDAPARMPRGQHQALDARKADQRTAGARGVDAGEIAGLPRGDFAVLEFVGDGGDVVDDILTPVLVDGDQVARGRQGHEAVAVAARVDFVLRPGVDLRGDDLLAAAGLGGLGAFAAVDFVGAGEVLGELDLGEERVGADRPRRANWPSRKDNVTRFQCLLLSSLLIFVYHTFDSLAVRSILDALHSSVGPDIHPLLLRQLSHARSKLIRMHLGRRTRSRSAGTPAALSLLSACFDRFCRLTWLSLPSRSPFSPVVGRSSFPATVGPPPVICRPTQSTCPQCTARSAEQYC